MFEVVVENVGAIYRGADETEAWRWYNEYAGYYKPWGCDWFAAVTLFDDGGWIMSEYPGTRYSEECTE
jgi:hypothetical protein